jgi:recombination DNA repair RAD52 pathway protein
VLEKSLTFDVAETVAYCAQARVVEIANMLFGSGGWSSQILSCSQDFVRAQITQYNREKQFFHRRGLQINLTFVPLKLA